MLQCSVISQAEGKGHLHLRPPRGGDLSRLLQGLIVRGQCLQDHPRTSPLSRAGTSSTPSASVDVYKRQHWPKSAS